MRSVFLYGHPVVLQGVEGNEPLWMLFEPISYYSEMLDEVIYLKEGIITNKASVTRLGLLFLGKDNPARDTGAVIHDEAYFNGGVTTHEGFIPMDRKTCDKLACEIWRVCGEKEWKVRVMGAFLKLGGWAAWRKYRKC